MNNKINVVYEIVDRFSDYFFLVEVDNEYNTTGDLELHDLNSESYIALGLEDIYNYLVSYRDYNDNN